MPPLVSLSLVLLLNLAQKKKKKWPPIDAPTCHRLVVVLGRVVYLQVRGKKLLPPTEKRLLALFLQRRSVVVLSFWITARAEAAAASHNSHRLSLGHGWIFFLCLLFPHPGATRKRKPSARLAQRRGLGGWATGRPNPNAPDMRQAAACSAACQRPLHLAGLAPPLPIHHLPSRRPKLC